MDSLAVGEGCGFCRLPWQTAEWPLIILTGEIAEMSDRCVDEPLRQRLAHANV